MKVFSLLAGGQICLDIYSAMSIAFFQTLYSHVVNDNIIYCDCILFNEKTVGKSSNIIFTIW